MNNEYIIFFKKKQKYKNLINTALIRLHKTNVSNAVINTNFNTIIDLYNDLRDSCHNTDLKLKVKQKLEIGDFLANVKVKLNKVSEKHQIRLYSVDNKIVRLQSGDSSESDSVDFSETIVENIEPKMTTVKDFLNLASKLLPEFDGTAENVQRFIDALNIINTIKENHELTAVELIKTKLKGNARNIVTNEKTINEIINKLKLKVKGDSVDTITAKIMNIKQQNKSANIYAKEIEELTKALEGAYISDGLNTEIAEKYATRVTLPSPTKTNIPIDWSY